VSKFQKVVDKLLNLNTSFTFQELEYLLGKLGYKEKKTGKLRDQEGHIRMNY